MPSSKSSSGSSSPTTNSTSGQFPKANGGAGSDELLAYSHLFVRMYSRLNSGQVVSGTLDPTGTKLQLQVIERNCTVYEETYSGNQVRSLKEKCNPALPWPNFFDLLQRTFAEHFMEWDEATTSLRVTIKHDRQTDTLPIAPFAENITLKLTKKSIEDFATKMAESMISFVILRTGDRKEMERVVDSVRVETALQGEAARLTSELSTLDGATDQLKKYAAEYDAEFPAVQQSLKATFGDEAEKVLDEFNPELVWCRVKNPWTPPTAATSSTEPIGLNSPSLDKDLLRVLKSDSYQAPFTNVKLYRYNRVVEPVPADQRSAEHDKLSPTAKALYAILNEAVSKWDEFNVMKLDELAQDLGGSALIYLGYYLFWRHGLPSVLNMDEVKLLNVLQMLSSGYNQDQKEKVPFHSRVHAADVLHALNYMITQEDGITRMNLKDTQICGALFAAMIHDFNHHGVNNTVHINSQSTLAQLYCDGSPMENYHLAQFFELLKLPQYNLLDCCALGVREEIERTAVEMVLATDMKRHHFYMSAYEARLLDIKYTRSSDVLMTLCMLLKAADVSNCAKSLNVYLAWAESIMQEYTAQGQLEASLKVPTSQSLMSSESSEVEKAKGQLGFINMIVQPLYTVIADAVPTLRAVSGQNIAQNKRHWAEKLSKK
jgi:hypothetical protein